LDNTSDWSSVQMNDFIAEAESKSLSGQDLKIMLSSDANKVKILNYDDLGRFNSIDELMGGDPAVIILMMIETPNAPRVGHWIALLNVGNEIEHFDPYGLKIDQELAITHEVPFLTRLVRKSTKMVRQSTHRFQMFREHVNTCGRWCVVRVRMRDRSNTDFRMFFDVLSGSADESVTLMTFLAELK